MTTIEEISQQIEDELALSHDELIAVAGELAQVRAAIKDTKKRDTSLTEQVKQGMELLHEIEITAVDPILETTHRFTLSEMSRDEYDLMTMAQRDPQKVIELARVGALTASASKIKGLLGKSDAADTAQTKYRMPRASTRLNITEIKA